MSKRPKISWDEDYFINEANADIRDEEGRTWLHRSCLLEDFDNVKALVEAGYDVNAVDSTGATPLHSAAMYNSYIIMAYLINHGSDQNITDILERKAFEYLTTSGIKQVNLMLQEEYNLKSTCNVSSYGNCDKYSSPTSMSGESGSESE